MGKLIQIFRNKLYLINLLRKTFLIFSLLLIYGSIIDLDSKCKSISKKVSFCKFISAIAKPQHSFTKGAVDFRKMVITRSTSRLLSTDIKESQRRFKEYSAGFNFNYEEGERVSSGFLLLSHADPKNNGKPSFELWDLNNQKILKKWDLEKAINFVEKKSNTKVAYFNNPLILKDESIIFSSVHSGSYLIKIDKNGKVIASNDEYYFQMHNHLK